MISGQKQETVKLSKYLGAIVTDEAFMPEICSVAAFAKLKTIYGTTRIWATTPRFDRCIPSSRSYFPMGLGQ